MSKNEKNLIVFIHPGFVGGSIPYPPYESLYLASYAENHGLDVMIIDQRVEPNWEQRLINVIDEVLWVGLTVITGPQILSALKTSGVIKEMRHDVPIVWGGWHPTFLPEQTIKHPLVDYVVAGIGELKIIELSQHIKNGEVDVLNNKAILHKNGNHSYVIEKESFAGLDKLPAYHLINIESYRSKNNIAGMITARGCPFSCSFCTVAQIAYINREIDTVINEIQFLINENKFQKIIFSDGLFFAQKKRVLQLFDKLKEKEVFFDFKGSMRPNTLRKWSDEEIERLKEAGLVAVNVGVETGSPKMLKKIKKDVAIEDVLHLAKITGKYDIELTAAFMCGLPNETVDDLKQTIDLIHRILDSNSKIRILNPFYMPLPGAPSYHEIIRLGWKPPKTLEEWALRNKYNISHEEVEPFPWLDREDFDLYMKTFRNSILNELRLQDAIGKQ